MLQVIHLFENRQSKRRFLKFKYWQNAYVPTSDGVNGTFFVKGNLGIFGNQVRVWASGRSGAGLGLAWSGKVRIVNNDKITRWFWMEVPNYNHIFDRTMDEIGEVTLAIPIDFKGDIYIEMEYRYDTSNEEGMGLQHVVSFPMNRKIKISK